MEKVSIVYEKSWTDTYEIWERHKYVKLLDVGRKWGHTRGNTVYVKRENLDKGLDEVRNIMYGII